MNQNWIVENLNNAFSTWNGKLTELWGLVTTSPQTFKGGAVWGVMQSLHNAMIGIGYALIVLFFAISLFKNTANFHELKRPEAAVHYLIRFVAAKTLVGYGMDIMLNIFSICNGVVSDMAAGMGGISQAMVALPGEVQAAIENVGFLASIPLWLVTILGSLFITVLSFVMILTVYGRFFRLYMYTALAPLPLASFAGESTQSVGMPDINFTMSDEDNKAKILNLLGKVYMGVPSDCWLKICIVSQRMDEKSFRENVLLHRNLDGLDKWRVERNRRIRQCVQDAGNVVQHKYLILSTNKQNVTDARSRLRQVQGNLLAELSNLGCTIKPMANNERLEVLHNFFRRGEEGRFQFSFDDYGNLGNDFRNTIAPDAMRFTTQHAEIDDGFAKAMTIAQYPQQLSDNFVATLLQQVPYIVLSIDITPVETEDAMREIEASQMKIDSEKFRANRRNVENLDFMATISPRNQQQEKYTAEIRNAICEGDQQVFMVLLSVAFFADTPDELRQETDALQSAASNFNCRFTEMRFQQENCFNTAMPYGLRRVESSHMMLTRSVTALVPFVAQEVQSPQGIFYGRNAITGNLIVGDRTKLINGNAMVIATSGSGKSMSVKMEIIMEFLRWPNARFILVDPENEYELLVKALGGEAIKVSVDSRTHFNPLDYHYDPKTDVPPDVAKIEFVLSMLDKLIGENGHLQPEDRSLIAASLKNIYKPLIASGYTAPCPTLGDLYRDLNKSNLRRAKQLALMLDVFANGSLQAFSHTTNVDMNNRLICFNIQSLGDQLRPIAMMSLLEFINMQVMTNRRKDATAATWIYFDEIHVLLKDPMSSNFLYSSWKRFRKYNAYATGISQDIQDYLDNPVAYALLSNSEFVIMLRQSKSLEALERLYGLSKPQLEFLRNASEGHGIIKMGNSMIPFSNLEPKDTAVYKLITTKPGEATAEK